ncbi:hypothetical protein Prum_051340 [Phytohabitans rumicis]|uniref:Uncharacterized protein n=1 Tax=Phytohabitans rumicis TaxID=1076125 RepID=A0A6V8L2G9_9ACTN|nr:hypothetical protein Prum_051340 [Phytohabitans rumicis]
MDGVHEFGSAGDGGERQAAGDALGGGDQVGDDRLRLACEPCSGAAEAGLDFVGDEHGAGLSGPVGQGGEKTFGGYDEAAFALDGFDQDGGDVVGADLLVDLFQGVGGGLPPVRPPSR